MSTPGVPWLDAFRDFRDQVVVVTGASSGIGRATAAAFGRAGARLGLVARREALLREVVQEVEAAGGAAIAVPTDVTDAAAVERAFAAIRDRFGGVDVVVNNAGILIPSPVAALRAQDLDAMLRVNLFGAMYVMQSAVPLMRESGGGSIVNVASLAGRRGVSPLGGYCATKFALVGLTEALRTELHGEPIHVALVMPGVVETPMVESAVAADEIAELWPTALNMPVAWVVWAIFAAVRFRLVEVAVPPGAAMVEKMAALAPGMTDALISWGTAAARWLAGRRRAGDA
jgi:NAD(P)-dependent dehydrogenase (short-subunit alcohol dehydrogenase family)